MSEELRSVWGNRADKLPLKSEEELLILASIIEKETGLAEDATKISQVFNKRLSINMKLQSDPTVIYAMGDSFDGNIRKRDLAIKSPYNTYTTRGCPPRQSRFLRVAPCWLLPVQPRVIIFTLLLAVMEVVSFQKL